MATISVLLKMIGLFCNRALSKRLYSHILICIFWYSRAQIIITIRAVSTKCVKKCNMYTLYHTHISNFLRFTSCIHYEQYHQRVSRISRIHAANLHKVTYQWVTSLVNAPCYIWRSPVAPVEYEFAHYDSWVTSHIHGSCHIDGSRHTHTHNESEYESEYGTQVVRNTSSRASESECVASIDW